MSVLKIKDQNNDWIQIPTIKGEKGDPFTYADFTTKQLESLKGKDGISPTVSVASDTSDDYRLSFTDETHTVTTPNLIPEAEKIFDVYPTDTASGSIASFSDGADGIPLKSLVVNIDPVQDLHGYDYPWPAGGGKNLFQTTAVTTTVDGVTFTVNSDGSIKTTGTPTRAISTFVFGRQTLPSGEYIANGFANGANSETRMVFFNENTGAVVAIIYKGNGVTFTLTEESVIQVYPIILTGSYESGWTFYPMIRKATEADATFAPYENICPISGWTGCEVQRTGKNLLPLNIWDGFTYNASVGTVFTPTMSDNSWTQGESSITYETTATYTTLSLMTELLPKGTYRCSTHKLSTGTLRYTLYALDKNYAVVSKSNDANVTTASTTVTLTEDGYITFRLDNGSTASQTVEIIIQVEVGDKESAYEPYTGQTYPITFPTVAGTVYGAYVDVTGGELVVDRAIIELRGQWRGSSIEVGDNTVRVYYSSSLFTPTILPNNKNNVINIYADKLQVFVPDYIVRNDVMGISENKNIFSNGFWVRVDKSLLNEATQQGVADWLAQNPITVCYKLAEPIHYTLTPTEIKTLLGQNNIWADTGDVSVEYRADTKLYIDNLTRSTEDDMTANTNISKDAYFTIGNTLYKASTAISKGETIVPNTNCTIVSLADALNTLTALTGGN